MANQRMAALRCQPPQAAMYHFLPLTIRLLSGTITRCYSSLREAAIQANIKANFNHLTLYTYLGINAHGSDSSLPFA